MEHIFNTVSCGAFMICSDFDTSFSRDNAQTTHLSDFMHINNLTCTWGHKNCIIRILLCCYIRHESRASRSSYCTYYFTMSNGIKQGGVLSAILFTLYHDKLLIQL